MSKSVHKATYCWLNLRFVREFYPSVANINYFVEKPNDFAIFLLKKRKGEAKNLSFVGTRNRGRTGTDLSVHRILSPACLPIPPFEQPPLPTERTKVQRKLIIEN